MNLCRILLGVHIYLVLLLSLIAIIGDYVVQHLKLHLYKALFDNITHASIGGLSWLIVCLIIKNRSILQTLFEIALCTVISSIIDVDHFLAACSFRLEDATNLQNRPLLHCTTIPCVISLIILTIAHLFQSKLMFRLAFIIFTAFLSHHTRDAARRGYWLYPFGSTPPIPYIFYIILTITIPYVVCMVMYYLPTEKHVDYVTII